MSDRRARVAPALLAAALLAGGCADTLEPGLSGRGVSGMWRGSAGDVTITFFAEDEDGTVRGTGSLHSPGVSAVISVAGERFEGAEHEIVELRWSGGGSGSFEGAMISNDAISGFSGDTPMTFNRMR